MLQDDCFTTRRADLSAYTGPERRAQAQPTAMTGWLARMLDEIDHGMLLVTPFGALRHANQPARHELSSGQTLCLTGSDLRASQPDQQHLLALALAEASRGRRRLVSFGASGHSLPVAVVPFGSDLPGAQGLVLLLLGKRQTCETLSLDFFARTHGLTTAEARVLQALCGGLRPKEVARTFDVAVSTVRTQISSIRAKTQTASIRELVHRVTTLPPIASAMKSVVAH